MDRLAAFLDRIREYRLPVVASLWPLTSLRNAEYLANEVPGLYVPPAVLDRMRQAQSRGTEADEGHAIARELLTAVRPLVQGVQIVAPFGQIAPAAALARHAHAD